MPKVGALYQLLSMVRGAKNKAIKDRFHHGGEKPLLTYGESLLLEDGLNQALGECEHEIDLPDEVMSIVIKVAMALQAGQDLTVEYERY